MILSGSSPFEAGSLVYAYLRHSPGDNQTIDSQEAAVQEWCEAHGLILLRVFKDESRTGSTTAGRDDFLLMIDTLRAELDLRPAGVVLWSFSRFARDFDDAQFYKSDLRRRGYLIHSVTDQIPDGAIGRLIESITDWKDEDRLREISKDSKRGLQWLAEQGYAIGGLPPRGYKKGAAVQVGKKKNGEPRLARRWEIDPEWETQVRKAWSMKLAGHSHLAIHRATGLFKCVTAYTWFFQNVSYAGYRKCGELIVANTQPAYVSREDFDKVQAAKGPRRYTGANCGEHPRRRKEDNPFVLSGILYCGFCGGAMVGTTNGPARNYRCLRKQRNGRESCRQHSIVAYWLHGLVCDWVTKNVLTLDHVLAAREQVNRRLSGSTKELAQRRVVLVRDIGKVDRSIKHLLDAVEVSGLSGEIGRRVAERRTERARLAAELGQIGQLEKAGKVEVSNEALAFLAANLTEGLMSGDPKEVRGVLRKVVRRVELHEEKISIHYVSPAVAEMGGGNVVYGRGLDRGLGGTSLAPVTNLRDFR